MLEHVVIIVIMISQPPRLIACATQWQRPYLLQIQAISDLCCTSQQPGEVRLVPHTFGTCVKRVDINASLCRQSLTGGHGAAVFFVSERLPV